jgi:hypothetical protein
MEKRPTYAYITIGGRMRYLEDAPVGNPVGGENYILKNLERVPGTLRMAGLPVSERAFGFELAELQEELSQALEADSDAKLTVDQHKRLSDAMRVVWKVVVAEATGVYAFIVSEKRLDTAKLLDTPGELFAPGVFASLSEIAQDDFRHAGRCVAFEEATAAAFHLMRATEAVLRDLYARWVRRDRIPEPRMWGPMISHLRARRSAPPKVLLDHLDGIRVNFRNPTQHPDATYDIHEAQDLFSVCVDAVNRAARSSPN